MVSQKSALKVENSIYEKRIQKKKERIGNLEKRVSDNRDQTNMYKMELDKLKSKLNNNMQIINIDKISNNNLIDAENMMNTTKNNYQSAMPYASKGSNGMLAFNSNKFGQFGLNNKFKKSNIINAKQLRFGFNVETKKTDKKA